MRSYRELFQLPEFPALFAAVAAQIAAQTVMGLALGVLVYEDTGSPLLAALSMFGSSFAQMIGATTLLSAADRLPPRAATAGVAALFAVAALVLAAPGLPVWAALAVVLALGLVASVGGGVRWGLLLRIVPEDGYLLGRSVINMAGGGMQIAGFAVGGALIALASARGALLIAAALFLAAAAVARLGLTRRPPAAAGRPSPRETWRVNRELWSLPARRHLYIALWVPNGLIVGCEALFVPYDPAAAGVLYVAGALGMLAGDTALGRFVPPGWRARLVTPLRFLLAAPFLLFAVEMPLPLAVVVVAVATFGYGATLLLQERLVALTGEETRGQALGLHSAGMLTMQAVGASVAGAVAQFLAPGDAMAVMATASLVVSLVLTPLLARGLALVTAAR
jgi:predicted MFS family arabinose efflux permease